MLLVPRREPNPHDLLLRLAGRLPDEVTTECRRWLSQGLDADVAQAVLFALLAAEIPIGSDDVEWLRELLVSTGHDPTAVDPIRGDPSPLRYGAAPIGPAVLAPDPAAVPYTLDLTRDHPDAFGLDPIDVSAVAVVRAASARALWRSWRYPPPGRAEPPARRVYLVLAPHRAPADLAALAAATQDALIAAGERDPQVEVFPDVDDLPPYQRHALEFAALLWASDPTPPVRIASGEDGPDPYVGPRLDGPERDLVLSYLDSGHPLLIHHTGDEDAVEAALPRSGRRVTVYRTDGAWIWTDLVAGDLRRHGVPPQEALVAHIRRREHRPADLDYVAVHRALSRLYLHDLAS
ncbi:hypothetical protein [Micromonospora sp. NPDC093277]|uniref:hypothetical protein n=1 Tax=Micromonospora sp. NPDC093277 TaxID=3364291 RepID=UPI00380AF9E5